MKLFHKRIPLLGPIIFSTNHFFFFLINIGTKTKGIDQYDPFVIQKLQIYFPPLNKSCYDKKMFGSLFILMAYLFFLNKNSASKQVVEFILSYRRCMFCRKQNTFQI